LIGAHRLLLDAGANFTLVGEAFLEQHLDRSRLVVLPEMPAIAPATAALLKEHVRQGGRLLVVGALPEAAGKPLDWVGITREKQPWQDHIYLPLWQADPDRSPVLVRGDFHQLHLAEAEAVLPAIEPYDCRHGLRFGWGIGPAAGAPSAWPALTRRRLGAGEAWYLEAPIFSDYRQQANWTQIDWFRELLARLLPRPSARLISESGLVELTASANANSTWAFLVNHGGDQLVGDVHWSRVLPPPPPYPVKIELAAPADKKPERVTINAQPIAWNSRENRVEIPLTMDAYWKIVRVDWA
jgi:hypothetical protein